MSYRKVVDLRTAVEFPGRPPGIPLRRPTRGIKAMGCRYEERLAAQVELVQPGARHGVWFEFWDKNGRGYCQPDILVPVGGKMLVLESKLTWIAEARGQIDELYAPVVEKALGLPVLGVVVCRALTRGTFGVVCGTLGEAIAAALGGSRQVVWHHIDAGLPDRRHKRWKKERLYA